MTKVAVIGAGVSGLTTAIVLAESGHEVELFAEKTGEATTSSAAAAIWFPYHIGNADDPASVSQVQGWACRTFVVLQALVPSDGRPDPRIGVSMIELRMMNEPALPAFECVEARRWESGYAIDVPLIDTPVYLRYLAERLGQGRIHAGPRFERTTDVDARFDVIVNCAGIEGGRLSRTDDSPMHRGRGVVLRGRSSQTTFALVDTTSTEKPYHQLMYIIPRLITGGVVVGGCDIPNGPEETDVDEGRTIFARAAAADPSLQVDGMMGRVGMRPTREHGVRLERETIDGRVVVHNYGHGGGGFTVSWGCAEEVLGKVG